MSLWYESLSNHTPEEYFVKAKAVLAKRPELAKLGRLVEEALSLHL